MILRGVLSLDTKSSGLVEPMRGRFPSSMARWTVSSTLEGDRFPTTTEKLWDAILRAKFWPMTARPYRPTSHVWLEEDDMVRFLKMFIQCVDGKMCFLEFQIKIGCDNDFKSDFLFCVSILIDDSIAVCSFDDK